MTWSPVLHGILALGPNNSIYSYIDTVTNKIILSLYGYSLSPGLPKNTYRRAVEEP